jgi:hypothetical protein
MGEFTKIKRKVVQQGTGRLEVVDGVASIVDLRYEDSEFTIDNEKALRKWKPILDALKVVDIQRGKRLKNELVDPYDEEDWGYENVESDDVEKNNKLRTFMSVYAEHHSFNENIAYGTFSPSPFVSATLNNDLTGRIPSGDIGQNLLPVSMKILSLLNLKDKNYEIRTGLDVKEISVKIKRETMNDIITATGMDIVQKLESYLIGALVETINKELETKDTIYIESMANALILVNDEDFNPIMKLRSRYEIK